MDCVITTIYYMAFLFGGGGVGGGQNILFFVEVLFDHVNSRSLRLEGIII